MVAADVGGVMGEQSQVPKGPGEPLQVLPPELAGKTLPAVESGPSENAEAVVAEDTRRARVADPDAAAAFGADLHGYVREYIALADQKAGVLFTLLTGMLAYLQTQNAARRWMVKPVQWGLLDLVAFVAVVGLLLGGIGALSVVVPRTRGSARGFVFWGAIADHRSASEYADRVAAEEAPSLVRAKLEHCHDLAVVCQRKYWFLDTAIWCGAVGLGAALVYVAIS
jgi:hypothetical protein